MGIGKWTEAPPRPGHPCPRMDARRALLLIDDVLGDLERLHGRGRLHGGVSPAAVRVGRRGAVLARPGIVPPPEYRDPERGREILRNPGAFHEGEPRSDVYGAGALLYAWLEGGPPPNGPASAFTLAVPAGVAWVAHRALAEGRRRYPTAGAMRRDVRRLLRLSAVRRIDRIAPSELPSHEGVRVSAPPRLVPFAVAACGSRSRVRRPRRGAAALLLAAVAGLLVAGGLGGPDVRVETRAPARSGLAAVIAGWRTVLDERLRAAGEELAPGDVPLLVVSDVPLPRDIHWRLHPSRGLRAAMREVLSEEVSAAEVQRVLLALVGRETLPAVLWITREPGTDAGVRARLFYRGLALEETVS